MPATREALSAEAHRLEAALDRFRAWRNQRAKEKATRYRSRGGQIENKAEDDIGATY